MWACRRRTCRNANRSRGTLNNELIGARSEIADAYDPLPGCPFSRRARGRRHALKNFLFRARNPEDAVRCGHASLGLSQIVLVEDRILRSDHLFQDYVHVFLAIVLVPKSRSEKLLSLMNRM
jgi:hypothetical protein